MRFARVLAAVTKLRDTLKKSEDRRKSILKVYRVDHVSVGPHRRCNIADRVKWSPGKKNEFRLFMRQELDRVISQRADLERVWRQRLETYRAKKEDAVAHYPFEGASSITYPLAAMTLDPILARYMTSIHATDNLWSLKALNEKWIDLAKPLQDYLQWLDLNILKMRLVNQRAFLEMLKLGTAVYKVGWRYERRNIYGYDQNKNRVRKVQIIDKPFVDHVLLNNFFIPSEARSHLPDEQGGAHWVAERHRMRPQELESMAKGQEPFLPNFDPNETQKAIDNQKVELNEFDRKVIDLEDRDATLTKLLGRPIDIWEVHARWDTTGNGNEEDIVVYFHRESHAILRATYEPLHQRPYSVIRYFPADGFYGIGVVEQAEVHQDALSDILNFNIDKIMLSNTPMLAVAEGANVVPDEPIFPGKQWHLADPKNDINPFFMVAPGSFDVQNLINFLHETSERRTGVTELQMGSITGLPSRTPAQTVQSLLAQGNTRFDMSMQDLRFGGLSEVGQRVLQNLQIQTLDLVNNPEAQAYTELAVQVLGEPEGRYVAQTLSIPFESIDLGIGVQLTATSGANNKELMKQSNLALLQILSQVYPQFIQLAQLIQQGGLVGEVAKQAFMGGQELVTRVLEQFDVRNPEEIVPNLTAQMAALSQMGGGQPIQPMAGLGAGGNAQGSGSPQGMGGF